MKAIWPCLNASLLFRPCLLTWAVSFCLKGLAGCSVSLTNINTLYGPREIRSCIPVLLLNSFLFLLLRGGMYAKEPTCLQANLLWQSLSSICSLDMSFKMISDCHSLIIIWHIWVIQIVLLSTLVSSWAFPTFSPGDLFLSLLLLYS